MLANFLFEQRAVQSSDKNGKFIITKPDELYHFKAARARITGKDVDRLNYMNGLSIRAQRAREEAEKQINEGRRQSNG